jgi:NTE family protein
MDLTRITQPLAAARCRLRSGAGWRKRPLALALQGGGAFGAFTWGVLDCLLEREIAFDAISGASSGAINALLLTSGLQHGGRAEARERLERFWHKTSRLAGAIEMARGFSAGLRLLPRVLSPYQLNPLGLNPLRDLLQEEIDFDALAAADIPLLIATTRVRDGDLRIFRNEDLTVEAVLASAALPMVHHAIAIDDEWYWDGGYAANPPLIPLVMTARGRDTLVVQVVPNGAAALPRTSHEIKGRLAQMAFNRPLMQELETIAEIKRPKGRAMFGDATLRRLRRVRLHCIRAEEALPTITEQSALNLDWSFLTSLRDAGRAAAERWLAQPTS